MSRQPRPSPGLVRPEFGPSLPDWLRARAGIPRWVTLAAVAAVVVLAGIVALLRSGGLPAGTVKTVHRGAPTFNVLYAPSTVRPATPQGDELMRFVAHGPHTALTVTVRPLRVPGFDPRLGFAGLPIAADRLETALRAAHAGFKPGTEGRARVNDAPGYQIQYRFRDAAGRRVEGHDVLVAPAVDADLRDGLIVSLRQTATGGARGPRDAGPVGAATSVFRSLRYGTDRG
jgi:hypothetical protein